MAIRRAVSADAPAIRDLTRAAYAKWVPLIGREPKPMGADYAVAVEAHLIDLLCIGPDLVALIEMIPEADCLLIENIAVAPAFQGRGHGRRLMGHAEQITVALGLKRMRLYTNAAFVENISLYRRLGYDVDREEPVSGGARVDMSKAL